MSTSKRSSQERSQGSRKPSLRYRIKIVWFYICSWVKLAWWGSLFWLEDQLLKLSPEAHRLKRVDQSYKALINSETTIDEIAIKNGCFEVKATSEAFHFLCRQVVEYMNSLGAKNFLEQECEFRIWSGPIKLIVTVQRSEGKTPATLLAEAEKRAKALETQIAMIHKLFAEAQSYSQGELLSEIALVVDWARPVETSPKYDPDWFKNEQN